MYKQMLATYRRRFRKLRSPPPAQLLVATLVVLGLSAPVRAETELGEYIHSYIVYSPYVVSGQSEIELRASTYRDSSVVLDHLSGQVLSVAHSFTPWWKTELYLGEYLQLPRQPHTLMAYEFENTFQLAPQGEYWADPGFLLSYEFNTHLGEANAVEFGPLFEKHSGRFDQRLNLLWEREIGTGAARAYVFRSAYSLSYRVTPAFAPGLEIYARPGANQYQLGPVLYGEHVWSNGSEFEYSASVVFGMNAHAPDMAFMLKFEYEFF